MTALVFEVVSTLTRNIGIRSTYSGFSFSINRISRAELALAFLRFLNGRCQMAGPVINESAPKQERQFRKLKLLSTIAIESLRVYSGRVCQTQK
jgi:hypothetical protein